jgi:hypothetical protein
VRWEVSLEPVLLTAPRRHLYVLPAAAAIVSRASTTTPICTLAIVMHLLQTWVPWEFPLRGRIMKNSARF